MIFLTRRIERTYNDNGDIVKEVSNDIKNGVSTLNFELPRPTPKA